MMNSTFLMPLVPSLAVLATKLSALFSELKYCSSEECF